MTKLDDIYDAVDDFGLITSAEAKDLGVSNAELVQLARRGGLVRVGRGVYRMPVWPYQESAPYAIAVKSVGRDAYLYGESVLALLGLAPTDPVHIWAASPSRVRKSLGNIRVADRQPPGNLATYDGVVSQPVKDAIMAAAVTMGNLRASQAAREAERRGYISHDDAQQIERKLQP